MASMSNRSISIMHTNDFHGRLDDARFERLKQIRNRTDLYFDCGDSIRTGNLGIPLKPDPVWGQLEQLRCTASVPGNRESHVLRSAFEAKVAGHIHPILCGNLFDKEGNLVLPPSLELELDGIRIGIFGVMVPMVTTRMKSAPLSQFIWTPPIEAAQVIASNLRPRCDLLIALTHIGHRQDQLLAETRPGIDLILGGHSHTSIPFPEKVGNTWIAQAGSHARFGGRYVWTVGTGITESELIPVG
jgi:2',3'-cyclic-nucleotide 2'-phosphodiesterase (5'-nucleotidase family)